MAPPAIRPAAPADLEAVSDCARAAYGKYVARIGREPAPMVADFASAIRAGEVFVLEEETRLLGFVVLRRAPDHLFVENVAVRPDAQGRGLGQRLMALAEETARAAGLPAIRLYTNVKMTENIPFYLGLGFVETGRRREDGFDRIYFERRL